MAARIEGGPRGCAGRRRDKGVFKQGSVTSDAVKSRGEGDVIRRRLIRIGIGRGVATEVISEEQQDVGAGLT